ncbi:ATP-dependent helicase HrpB [Alteromonas sp. C1M14]|uniref:ATP-dependent helicase HrpB n=1 Tax=Alteromonas sp. C1M14 TaxID=2841567 RepID=UPI001C0A1E07|nr:ATP-dependent helicase HrpB [Alteromonas sp. C1M14]MBU2978601.1 ATP-dependent helicase HrpB [Alteromonas sp. C1M14]
MSVRNSHLPASTLIPALVKALGGQNVIVGAPPGAGKSTVLPLALLEHTSDKIILLQPRRVVVRNLATYLAAQLGESVGETVGYRIRGESKVSAHTRLEIVTEGVLSRRITQDPELSGVAAIVFDEFHERSIHSDFGLALALEVQEGLREDLSLVVMSATLDVEEITALIPQARLLTTEGRQFPVTEVYIGNTEARETVSKVVSVVANSLATDEGDILVFLPGAAMIRKVAQHLAANRASLDVMIHTLYGRMTKSEQDAAIKPDPRGRRKVILATNIAETSLTIEGVTVVVDSGLENAAKYHPATGLVQLTTQMISQASATQRKGRAGRLQAGKVYRLWSEEQQSRLARQPVPQIQREDISTLLLDALGWGTSLPEMALMTQPSQTQIELGLASLKAMNAVNAHHQITPYGKKLLAFPTSPALAHMLYQSQVLAASPDLENLPQVACFCAALAEESLALMSSKCLSEGIKTLDGGSQSRVLRQAKRYSAKLSITLSMSLTALPSRLLALCLALAFPQRVAFKRQQQEYKLACGRGAVMPQGERFNDDWLVVLSGQLTGSDVKIDVAEPITETDLRLLYPDAFLSRTQVTFNAAKKQMEARKVVCFSAIVLSSEPVGKVSSKVWGEAWYQQIRSLQMNDLPLSSSDLQWWYRYKLACDLNLPQSQAYDEAPPWRQADTMVRLIDAEVLTPRLTHCKQYDDLAKLPWSALCHESLPWSQQYALDSLLPPKLTVPGGEKRKLTYRADGEVLLSVRLQEMFGCNAPITLANGQKTVTVELLSPAGRPIQKTADLGSFWQGSYFAVQKEMKGRYPKHRWPDRPMEATPGKSIKPKN